MMSQFLRDALIDMLFRHMAEHIERGVEFDEALRLGVDEIRRQIRGSRADIERQLVDQAVSDLAWTELGKTMH